MNLIQFIPLKAQVREFNATKDPFIMSPQFQGVCLQPSTGIGILGVDISNDIQYRTYLAKPIWIKSAGSPQQTQRYFTPEHKSGLKTWSLTPISGPGLPTTSYFIHTLIQSFILKANVTS